MLVNVRGMSTFFLQDGWLSSVVTKSAATTRLNMSSTESRVHSLPLKSQRSNHLLILSTFTHL
jgi:hypothetical protein